ncbi:hypothetical protein ACHAPJ_004283 [Fusarium lateritium]
MASNPPPPGGAPASTNNAPLSRQNVQPNASNGPQPAANSQASQQNQGQSSRELLADPEGPVELLTEQMRQRLEETLERSARTEEDLQGFGISPEEYDDDDDDMMEIDDTKEAGIEVNDIKDRNNSQKRIKFSKAYVDTVFEGENPYSIEKEIEQLTLSLRHTSLDIITALCCNLELAIEIGKHLRPKDIVNLYIANAGFRKAVDGHMLSCVRMWVDTRAREAGKIFHWKLYGKMLIKDPAGRRSDQDDARFLHNIWETAKLNPDRIRLIPGFKYLQMVIGRDRYCREILAVMARMGFRMPDTMYSTLLRLWVLLEVSTTRQRNAFLRNKKYWTDQHLYNVQFFLVKLAMAFTHPFFHPINKEMVKLMMGQKGLYPLWQCLMRHKYRNVTELMELKARYDMRLPRRMWEKLRQRNVEKVFNVEIRKLGLGHTEGWGNGVEHLARPDEVLPVEAVMRALHLDDHIAQMMVWGYIDFETGENLVPTEEEMYISDEEETMAKADNTHHWQRKHALKKRWTELSPEEQQEIKDDDQDEQLRALAWSSSDNFNARGGYESESESEPDSDSEEGYNINTEIDRGYRMPPPPTEEDTEAAADTEAWHNFCRAAILDTVPEVNEADYNQAKRWTDFLENDNMGNQPPGDDGYTANGGIPRHVQAIIAEMAARGRAAHAQQVAAGANFVALDNGVNGNGDEDTDETEEQSDENSDEDMDEAEEEQSDESDEDGEDDGDGGNGNNNGQ